MNDDQFHELIGIKRSFIPDLIEIISPITLQRGTQGRFSKHDELFIFLLHFRHYPSDVFLAAFFQTSKGSICNIRTRVQEQLFHALGSRISFLTLAERDAHSVQYFGRTYTFIVDGSEQPVSGSGNPFRDTEFYSVKKGEHTINILLAIQPTTKRIYYLSKLFPGSINDNEIMRKTRQDWHDKLSDEEWGMGDKGFNGLIEEGLRISTPGKNQLANKYFSSVRIQVEKLKNFQALKQKLRIAPYYKIELLNYHQMNWVIGAVFCNEFV